MRKLALILLLISTSHKAQELSFYLEDGRVVAASSLGYENLEKEALYFKAHEWANIAGENLNKNIASEVSNQSIHIAGTSFESVEGITDKLYNFDFIIRLDFNKDNQIVFKMSEIYLYVDNVEDKHSLTSFMYRQNGELRKHKLYESISEQVIKVSNGILNTLDAYIVE